MSTLQTTSKTLTMGKHQMELGGKYLGHLRDANALLSDTDGLRERMKEDGYLLIRNFHPREKIEKARKAYLEILQAKGAIEPGTDLMLGRQATQKAKSEGGDIPDFRSHPAFLEVVESPELMTFFESFFGEKALTFDYKWIRAVDHGNNTGAHYDVVYMGRGSSNLYTCWTPYGDLELEQGTLAILEGSHNLESYRKLRETYGKSDVDRDHTEGWFSRNPIEMVDRFGGRWLTSEFKMGDILIFGMHTMHASLNNNTHFYRLSSDTRYQPASEPADERWVGEKPVGHYAWKKGPVQTNEKMRKAWNL